MAVVNTKSAIITNLDASPVVLNDVTVQGGRVRSQCGTVEVAAADDDTSVYHFARVPSNARITSIKRYNDAITGMTVCDIGLYRTAADGGAVVSANAYANDVDINAGTVAGVEHAFTTRGVEKIAQRVWQDAGLSADSKVEYDLCLTAATVGSGAGTISFEVQYVID